MTRSVWWPVPSDSRVGRGTAWVVTDAFFNLEQTPPGWIGWVMKLAGNCPGMRIGGTFRWIALADQKSYAVWLREQLATDPPALLIPGHGLVDSGPQLAARLDALAQSSLPSG